MTMTGPDNGDRSVDEMTNSSKNSEGSSRASSRSKGSESKKPVFTIQRKRAELEVKTESAPADSNDNDVEDGPKESPIGANGNNGEAGGNGEINHIDAEPALTEESQQPKTGESSDTKEDSEELQRLKEQVQNMEQSLSQQRQYNASFLQKLLEAKGNIQVYCRIRPLTPQEEAQNQKIVVEAMPNSYETACWDAKQQEYKSFVLDRTWGPQQSQLEVFQDVEPLALSVVQGYNACILAYGQTGSGKTYTMQGEDERDWGISFRTLEKLWTLLSMRSDEEPNYVYSLELGMLEIYNDEVYDLLNTTTTSNKPNKNGRRPKLDVRRNAEGRLEVPQQHKERISSIPEVQALMERAQQIRATATTNLNEHSSRSHMVLSVDVSCGVQSPQFLAEDSDGKNLDIPLQQQTKASLFLVDLAGSERVKRSRVEGEQLKEAGYINKSLSALGNVMEALDRKNSHIPYRDSKLTYILQDALGGGGSSNNSRTMMIVNVSPVSLEESLNTLQFATRVRNIQLSTAQRNQNISGSVAEKNLHHTISTLQQQVRSTQTAHDATAAQCYSLQKENARLQEQVKGLEKARQQARALQALQVQHSNLETRHEQESLSHQKTQQALQESQEHVARLGQQLAQVSSLRLGDDGSHTTLATEDTGEEFVAMVRQRVLELLQEHDPAKVDKLDALMKTFQGKESILLERMTQRYQKTNKSAEQNRKSNGSFNASFWRAAALVVLASVGLYKFFNGSRSASPPAGEVPPS